MDKSGNLWATHASEMEKQSRQTERKVRRGAAHVTQNRMNNQTRNPRLSDPIFPKTYNGTQIITHNFSYHLRTIFLSK